MSTEVWTVIVAVAVLGVATISLISTMRHSRSEKHRKEHEHKINVLMRCANVETELDALNEVLATFHGSRAVMIALQRYHIGLELRRKTQPVRKKSGSDILGVIKQMKIDELRKELIEAMCRATGINYGIVSTTMGFTKVQLARWEYQSNFRA